MMMDYIAYLQAYTPKFQGPPRYYRIAKSAPLNTAPEIPTSLSSSKKDLIDKIILVLGYLVQFPVLRLVIAPGNQLHSLS